MRIVKYKSGYFRQLRRITPFLVVIDKGQHIHIQFRRGEKGASALVIKEILDADEVAQMLRVHPRTVMRLATQGQLPGFKVGGQWRFRREAIEEYIREQEQLYSAQKRSKASTSDDSDVPPTEGNDEGKVDKS
jgi:excisionase family DNA binding protein